MHHNPTPGPAGSPYEMADKDGLSLRDAALKGGKVDATKFDAVVDPRKMAGEGVGGA